MNQNQRPFRFAVWGAAVLYSALVPQMAAWMQTRFADFDILIPRGLDPLLPVPQDNPLTDEKVELGRRLFFDPILSDDGAVSCASCHVPDHGFAGDTPVPEGIGGSKGRRNAPTLLNRAYGKSQFWDGRAATLEEQSLMPIESPTELGTTLEALTARLQADAAYRRDFSAAFEDGITARNIARAIASFERTLLSGDSPADRFMAKEFTALSDRARKGKWLFESRAQCWRCHAGPNFTDEKFHNTGVGWESRAADRGRFEVTGRDEDRGRFKTPTLRDVARTPPYMHDGSRATLREVVESYRMEGDLNPYLDPLLKPLTLSDEDVANLVAYLESLTGRTTAELISDRAQNPSE